MHTFTLTPYPSFLLAWSDEWPGMVAGAYEREDLAWQAPLSIAEYRAWLQSHGEEGPAEGEWTIGVELVPGPEGSDADPCYPADLQGLDQADFARFLRHARLAQADLAAAADLPDVLLDWAPKGLVPEHADPWAPDPRTIRGIATHALQLEVFYREGLRDGAAAGIFERVGPIAAEQARTMAVIEAVAAEGLDRVFHPRRVSRREPEGGTPAEWTVRKVLRRLISHNRQHAIEIGQRRSWIITGIPPQG